MTERIYYDYLPSPVGKFLLAGTPDVLCFTGFTTGRQQRDPKPEWRADPAPLDYAVPQFEAYFAGEPTEFNIPLRPIGTAFQMAVWTELQAVGFGQTASYGDIAWRIGEPDGAQAVGAANAANHLPIVIPCHRIIGSDGRLVGFGGGLDTKERLLLHEGALAEQFELF